MKKVLALVLAVVLAFGMATVAFAGVAKIDKEVNYNPFGRDSHDWGEVAPGDKAKEEYPLGYSAFQWDLGKNNNDTPPTKLTTSTFSSSSVTVKRKVSKGSDLIKKVELKNKNNGVIVEVELIDPFVSTSEKDFDFTIYLAKKGTKMDDTELQITGTLKNEIIEVDEGEDEVNLSEGAVAEAIAYIKNITVDTGNGLYINTKMFEDRKYYAKSTQDITAADDAVVSQYTEIDTIYTLYSVNMSSAGNTVYFDIDDTYYVYNAEGQYLGTTADKNLPFSSKYYLAVSKIDMTGDIEPGDEVPVDPDSPDMGGDDVPANANDNPGTGANGFVNVAVVAGLVALAAAGAVSMKK